MTASCLSPLSYRWQDPISTYKRDYLGELPTKELEKPIVFEPIPISLYRTDFKGVFWPARHYKDLLFYQTSVQRRKHAGAYESRDRGQSKKIVRRPPDNYPVLRKDPDRPPVKISLPERPKIPSYHPDESRRGKPWPVPHKEMAAKYPDMDMYKVDELAYNVRWTTSTRQQQEEGALPVTQIDPKRLTFEKRADPVRFDIQRYYSPMQDWQKVDMWDRYQVRAPVPRVIPPVETRDVMARYVKKKLETRHDNIEAMEKEKLDRIKKLVENDQVSSQYIPKVINYAGYIPRQPKENIVKSGAPPNPAMQSTTMMSYRQLPPLEGISDSTQNGQNAPLASSISLVNPHNTFNKKNNVCQHIQNKFYSRDFLTT
ncbi:uncharacterized protein LOC121389497 [Gigantopelta aegis]|uniref:uncharacterized protein LOC121389497 n=1 Tax=Gigantopelta aegis TaxID=1735272 RepID=UPI001B88BED9|nr:uncharacterized protein LOC121389497 [Gigantopelta aegis]